MADGGVVFAGRTVSGAQLGKPDFRNSSVYVARLNGDGAGPPCELTFGGDHEDYPWAMIGAPDGTILVAGTSQGDSFPFSPATPRNPQAATVSFLTLVDPCRGIRFATPLPSDMTPSALATAPDGSILVVGALTNEQGILLRIDSEGKRTVSRRQWNALPTGLALDRQGRIYVAGMRDRQAVVARFSSDWQTIDFEVAFGEPAYSVGLALLVADDGNIWVAGGSVAKGQVPYNLSAGGNVFPGISNAVATLTHIRADGTVNFSRPIEAAPTAPVGEGTYAASLALSSDGSLWVGIVGSFRQPANAPDQDQLPLSGLKLRRVQANGDLADGDFIIPHLSSGQQSLALGPNGRLVVAGPTRFLPVTLGSADAGTEATNALVAFDLRTDAPRIEADREFLEVDQYIFDGSNFFPGKTVKLTTNRNEPLGYVATVVPNGPSGRSPDLPQVPFSIAEGSGSLPAAVRVNHVPRGPYTITGVLVVLAPGARGVFALPLRHRELQVRPTFRFLAPFAADSSASLPVSAVMRVALGDGPLPMNFSLSTDTAWLGLSPPEGTTPADIVLTADPRRLGPGAHVGRLTLNVGGSTHNLPITFEVGPALRLDPLLPQDTFLVQGQSLDQRVRLISTMGPINFTVESNTPWVRVSPTSGRTPQEITMSGTPPSSFPGNRVSASFTARYPGRTFSVGVSPFVVTATPILITDAPGRQSSPGALHYFGAGSGRCSTAEPQPTPWPTTLGGCMLRLNGRALPLGRIDEGWGSQFNGLLTRFPDRMTAHIPDDVELGKGELELEDREGKKSVFPFEIVPLLPWVPQLVVGPAIPSLEGRPGEEITVRLSGLGRLDGPAAAGDVASEPLNIRAALQAFVGGRLAAVRSATLSRTEVGVVEIRIQIPNLGPDGYNIHLRIAGQDYLAGYLTVRTP